MSLFLASLALAGLVPIGLAFWTNRRTSLAHALGWTLLAWMSWTIAIYLGPAPSGELRPGRYIALCLTGCAGIAVLGARRPHVGAWNFVVLGLFVVMLLPMAESLIIRESTKQGLRILFLAGTIAVGLGNYIPTRFWAAALVLLVACLAELNLGSSQNPLQYVPADVILICVPWVGWACTRYSSNQRSEFDRTWLEFRDRWGTLWTLRAREQFNLAAQNAGWPVHLEWSGLKSPDGNIDVQLMEKCLVTLRAILQRFIAAD